MKFFLFCFFILFATILLGQTVKIDSSTIFIEYKNEEVSISQTADSFKIISYVSEKKVYNQILDPTDLTDYIYEGFHFDVRNISAHIYNPIENKKTFKLTRITGKSKTALYDGSSFYDDNVYYQLDFNSVIKGGYTELSYYKYFNEPHFLSPFQFTDNVPSVASTYSIILDPGIEIGWHLYGLKKDDVILTIDEIQGKLKYTWSLKNCEPVLYEKDNNGFRHIATHIVPFIKSYTSNGKQKMLLSNTEDLFQWYQSLIGKIKPSDNSELQQLTFEIIQGSKNDTEKAQSIFHWVQDNIRYIDIEDGWRGFIPFPAAEICQKRYGDCKDMTHLMYEMMNIADLNAEHAWIGTRELPYKYNEIPSPAADNHLILLLFIENDTLVLDATDSHTPFGVPTSFILGKEALFKNKDGKASIYKIPEYSADNCIIKNEIVMESNGKNLFGSVTKNIESFELSTFQNYHGQANTDRDQYIKTYLELGANNVIIKNEVLKDTNEQLKTTIDYDFELPNYILNFDITFIINLNLTKPFSTETLQLNRISTYEIEYKKGEDLTISFTLPEGKKVKKLPADVLIKTEFGMYSAIYRMDGDKVIYNRKVTVEKLDILPSEIPAWNNYIRQLNEIYKTKIEYN